MIYEAPHLLKIAEMNERYENAMRAIRSIIPEDYSDWMIHGVAASDTYSTIIAAIETAYGKNNDKLDCSVAKN
jgi:L-rhamnose isomerase